MCFILDPSQVRRVPIQAGIQRKLNFVSVRTIKGRSSQTPLLGHRRGHARARAVPRSSPLFAQRPRSTWVSLRTARQGVKPNGEELRARPAHKDHLSGAGARNAGRPDPQLWCARAHTQAPAHRDAYGRLTRNLRSCPTLRLPPRPVLDVLPL